MKKIDYLINYLLKENQNIRIDRLPSDEKDKENLYRSLCNIREAKEISEEYLKIENEYLQEKLKEKKIANIKEIKPISKTITKTHLKNSNKICLWEGDITTLKIDIIVNAANSQGLRMFYTLP